MRKWRASNSNKCPFLSIYQHIKNAQARSMNNATITASHAARTSMLFLFFFFWGSITRLPDEFISSNQRSCQFRSMSPDNFAIYVWFMYEVNDIDSISLCYTYSLCSATNLLHVSRYGLIYFYRLDLFFSIRCFLNRFEWFLIHNGAWVSVQVCAI